jgi:hypothetical protein
MWWWERDVRGTRQGDRVALISLPTFLFLSARARDGLAKRNYFAFDIRQIS